MSSEFVHLHVHTEYSLLDGQSRIHQLVSRAKELEMPAIGISDHGVMFGVIDFYKACRDAGITPVVGMEAYLAPRTRFDKDSALDKRPYHLLMWAQNMTGYKNLMKLASKAQLEGYYYRPRVDWELLEQYSEGIIATSGCLAAEIPRMVEDGKEAEARATIGKYLEVFGEDNFYLELQPHNIDMLGELNKWLIDYRKSNHTKVQFYASNDVHYVYRDDWDVHDTLLCIQTSALKSEQNRMRMDPQDSYYMKSANEMRREFLQHGMPEDMINEAFANSLKIASMTDINLTDQQYHLPIFPVPPEFADDSAAYLRYLCDMGLGWRFPGHEHDSVLTERLDRELEIIGNMGFNTYFLIVWDLCEFAREADIWWNVRGSGAGSLVAYCLGITNIDPIQNSLLFERFLNPGRISMPDIDLDYPDDRRSDMIAYAANKYGKDKVAAIITFGTMGAKASVKDVGRALDVDLAKVTYATSLIPQEAKQKPIREYIDMNPELSDLYRTDADIQKVMDTAIALQGMTRHASTHAAGIIIADKPLDEYTPLHRITGQDATNGAIDAVVQFPMETAEEIGLLKVDFLGLSTLTILRLACDLVNKHHGTDYNMDNIPYRHDDLVNPLSDYDIQRLNQAFEMMGRGETIGVFQIEGGGMQSMLRGMRPNKFEHIIAGVSLYRPGPMEFIPRYNARLHGQEDIPYKHEALIPILSETYGIITYQEQIMQIASNLFGYKLGEADLMRKAVSKKREKDLMQHKAIFKERGPENGVPVEIAEAIFDEIEYFANYGFNKCISKNTEIVDFTTGRVVTVGDLYEGRSKISETLSCNIDSLKLQSGKITDVMFNGIKPVFRLTTQTGRTIDATGNHPFYTFDGWQNLENLAVGDRIAIPRRIPVEGKKEWDTNQIGAFVERFYSTDEMPQEIFELTNDSLSTLLAELANQYGSVGNKRYKRYFIFGVSATKKARQLQHLLSRFGILSTLRSVYWHAEVESELVTITDLEISQPDSLQKLLTVTKDNISIELWRKIEQLVKIPVTTSSEPIFEEPEHDIYWDEIVSIEYIGEEPTYDLTIEGTHNFIANDILVHNSHATDYAVITVQSAFLKCHYTAEFMTALLTVHFDDNTKVAMFLEECRRLQIPVLPPHVNQSAIDFDIENSPDGQRGIRFGLGAIKNAGVGALEHIINERNAKGKFKSLVDFCHRVDLRQVGKRAVESLIKVGAFEGWGERDDLLLSLDRMMGFSGDYHKAQEVGQKSMFGEAMGFEEQLDIPKATDKQKFSRREQLGWEKELMGLYVSGRPVDRHLAKFRAMGNLSIIADMKNPELQPPQGTVKIAGEVVNVRKILTKNNEQMAVITMEDWHDTAGSIEVVFFPRNWVVVKDYVRRHKEEKARQENDGKAPVIEIEVGDILVAIGKYDKQRETPQIIGDKVDFEFEYVSADEIEQAYQPYNSNREWMNNSYGGYDDEPPPYFPTNDYDEETGEVLQPSLPPAMPPSPKDSVSMLEAQFGSSNGNGNGSAKWANGQHVGNGNGHDDDTFADMLNQQGDSVTRHIKVTIQRSAETDKDRRRLRRIYSAFSSYPGADTFSMVIETPAKPITMVFPETKTGWCDALRRELEAILGEGHIHISATS